MKIDYHLNEHNTLNGEYFFGQSTFNYPNAAIQPYWFTISLRTGSNDQSRLGLDPEFQFGQ